MGTFTTDDQQFLLDGAPFRILSGALHYFRIRPEQWDDRLYKLRAMGLNTVETYVAWNLHEPRPGEFDFSGGLDLADFIERAARIGLRAIVRPGPYICAEWDMGGLPSWLLRDPAMRLRCMYQPYLDAVDRYLDALLPRLAPLQISRGGPIIAVQVENEYGSYGNDYEYLQYLADGTRARGIDCLLFTSDGPEDAMLQSGTLPQILKTVNFGSRAGAAFDKLREYQPSGPLMCMEFWNGWFDHWGAPHHTRPAEDAADALDEILAAGASVNFYMLHGGTNFGFTSGANQYPGKPFEPTVTSYDYDSAVSEAGDLTPKYHAFRAVIGKYAPLPDMPLPEPAPKLALGPIALPESASLLGALAQISAPVRRAAPEPMEALGQASGLILYRTSVVGPRDAPLTIAGLHDRAQVFVNGAYVGALERGVADPSIEISVPAGGATIDLLVEAMGRVNYGPYLADRKGIVGGVALGQQLLFGWEIFPLPLDDLGGLQFTTAARAEGPSFFRGEFAIAEPRDTFLALPGWAKGVAWVNGFNLGRYWSAGPQRTLYVPAPILRAGANQIVLLELHQAAQPPAAELRDTPDLGPTE